MNLEDFIWSGISMVFSSSFFSQTAEILESDPSLYCACAWNDLSAMHTGGDPTKVLRMENQPAYGWMVTREFFKELSLYWISPGEVFTIMESMKRHCNLSYS